ncbi:MAG TPA: hypothetical protein VE861_16965 [Gemmatimonadaceae bacterium]|nr:hypothetical protein [Gemmatimonadaceae bacterium]
MRIAALSLTVLLLPAVASAQASPSEAEQITAATLPLPASLREGAGVMGYRGDAKLVVLRAARNGMQCLADDPADERFHVACYATTLEPFMARGRALRAAGTTGPQVDTVRFAEVKSGKLAMPRTAASLYSLSGPKGDFDAATGRAPKSKPLFVLYMPNATAASTGISATPGKGPWLMYPGTPKAHLMLTPEM